MIKFVDPEYITEEFKHIQPCSGVSYFFLKIDLSDPQNNQNGYSYD